MKTQRFGSVTMAILGVAVLQACLCSGAYAGSNWTVPAKIEYQQSYDNAGGEFTLQQTGEDLHGSATNSWVTANSNLLGVLERGATPHFTSGDVLGGRIDGDHFTLTVRYRASGTIFAGGDYIYDGSVNPTTGLVTGEVYNDLTPKNRVRFATTTPLNRVNVPTQATAVPGNFGRPIRITGRPTNSGQPIMVAANAGKPIKTTGRPTQVAQPQISTASTTSSGGGFVSTQTMPNGIGNVGFGTTTQTMPNGGGNVGFGATTMPDGAGNTGFGTTAQNMLGGVGNGVGGTTQTMPNGGNTGFGTTTQTMPNATGNIAFGGMPQTSPGGFGTQMGGPGGMQTNGPGGGMPVTGQTMANFTGNWNIVAADGTRFLMALSQNGNVVNGNYSPRNGMISGQVGPDGKLTYRWQDGAGNQGSGQFMLSPDGSTCNGTFSTTADPTVVSGTWGGPRQ